MFAEGTAQSVSPRKRRGEGKLVECPSSDRSNGYPKLMARFADQNYPAMNARARDFAGASRDAALASFRRGKMDRQNGDGSSIRLLAWR